MANTGVNENALARYGNNNNTAPVTETPDGALFTAQDLPPYTEQVRQGQSWSVMNVLAIAALVVRPTTVAAVEIYNGDPVMSLIIEDLLAFNLVSTAVNSNAGLWCMVTAPKAAPSAGANIVPWGSSGKVYRGKVVVGLGTTIVDTPGNGNGWVPFGPNYIAPSAAAPGGSWRAPVDGKRIVPPGCALAIHVVGSIVGDTYQVGAEWIEKALPLL